LAAVDVQNRVSVAQARLPEEVVRQGVTVRKQSTDFVMVVSLNSPENRYDNIFLSNYATLNLTDTLARVPGVGNVRVFGARDYGMRIWLRPDRMARLGVTASDVSQAIREQNVQAPAGQIGLPPAPPGQEMQYSVIVQGRLSEVSQYEDIIVRAQPDGSFVRMGDIARVELGATDYASSTG
jgi:multidrug efflux pump subunit AcrB